MGLDSAAEHGPPAPWRLLALLPVVALVAYVDTFVGRRFVSDLTWSVAASVLAAAVIGVPVLFWLLERRRRSVSTFVVFGMACGAAVPAVMLATGFVGQWIKGGSWGEGVIKGYETPFWYTVWIFKRHVVLPGVGSMFWGDFLIWAAHCVAIGLVSALAYRLLLVPSRA